MSYIGEISLIYQNSHIPSLIASDYAAREIFHKQLQEIINKDKEIKITKIKPVEEIDTEKKAKNHIDLKA